jgi:hypothetical protein
MSRANPHPTPDIDPAEVERILERGEHPDAANRFMDALRKILRTPKADVDRAIREAKAAGSDGKRRVK